MLRRLEWSRRRAGRIAVEVRRIGDKIGPRVEFRRQIAELVDRIVKSDAARVILPAPLLASLSRAAARLRGPWSGGDPRDTPR